MSNSPQSKTTLGLSRLLGVGLTAVIAVITIVLAATGSLSLYINPDGSWFTIAMAVLALVGCAASFAIKLGDEAEHGHDHGGGEHHGRARLPAILASVVGGVIAVAVVGTALVLPSASLSAQTAMDRDVGITPLFGGDEVVALATTGDTATFGVGEWATVFATAPDARLYEGAEITISGFITPSTGAEGGIQLTRLVVTHCVIDAQPASIPLGTVSDVPETGQWVSVSGVVVADASGALAVQATDVVNIDEPADPYEY